MDFDRAYVEEHEYGRYERLDPALLPNLYIAYDPNRAEVSGTRSQLAGDSQTKARPL